MSERLRNVFQWPEFRPAWYLLVAAIAVFLVGVFELPALWVLTQTILLALIVAFTFLGIYKGATAERAAAVEHGELEGILASTVDALVLYDSRFRIVFWNPAAERLFKISARDALGHVISPQDMQRPAWCALAQVVFPTLAPRIVFQSKEGEFPQTIDLSLADPPLELRVITAPVQDAQGRAAVFIKVVHDRTPQIAALRSNIEFITVASHQLRGPITDISWALQVASEDRQLDDSIRPVIDNAYAASKNLIKRIEDLLDVARIEEGKVGYIFNESDIADFVGGVLAGVLPQARKTGIKLYFDRPSEPLPHVFIDEKRLSAAVTNLLENAIRYNVENGEVVVRVDQVPGQPFVEVSIKDTGIGIPPGAIPNLFVKFYRAENAVQAQTEGTGIGLFIAKNVIAAHGGEIKVVSELNRGTTMTFTLPTDRALVPQGEIGPEGFLL
ncbi:MAG: PAS domain-containing protein [Patescibacteria group bacterium]|nr:PAS domain-containing protein [Patescibacteria group bacterium]